jgi:hypothetical protein
MTRRPIVVYVESDSSGFLNDASASRDALSYFLKERCACEVVQYRNDFDFREDLPQLRRYSDCHRLILVIVKQERHMDQHDVVIRLVHSRLSATIPVVVIPDGWGEERFSGDSGSLVYAFDYTDTELVELVGRLVSKSNMPVNWFGVETEEDQAILMGQLENAYCKHYLVADDEGMLGVPDVNHRVVAEALRLRSLPAELLKGEFDDTIKETPRTFDSMEPSLYEKEIERVGKMTDEERKDFLRALMRAMGHEPIESGGVRVIRVSCGDDVNGFAIDPVTFEALITYRFGDHYRCGDMLAQRIQMIEALKSRKHFYELSKEKERECRWRLMTGLIFTKIDGFKTPILQLDTDEAEEGQVLRVKLFLYRGRKFIPVSNDGHLL